MTIAPLREGVMRRDSFAERTRPHQHEALHFHTLVARCFFSGTRGGIIVARSPREAAERPFSPEILLQILYYSGYSKSQTILALARHGALHVWNLRRNPL